MEVKQLLKTKLPKRDAGLKEMLVKLGTSFRLNRIKAEFRGRKRYTKITLDSNIKAEFNGFTSTSKPKCS